MSRESKIINAEGRNAQTIIKHYESFGWELLSINNAGISMTRETQNPVYSELVKYEAEYEELTSKINSLFSQIKRVQFDLLTCIKRLLLLIIPGVIYIKNYKTTKENNERLDEEIKVLVQKREEVCNNSRAVFFSKQ